MIVNFKSVKGSAKSAHQTVIVDDGLVGEVWREQVNAVVSKLTAPRQTALKWRWFARRHGAADTLGRGTRAAMLFGPGFKSKDAAIDALLRAVETSGAREER